MIPKNVYDLCHNGQSVTSELAKDPSLTPHHAQKKLFGVGVDDEIHTKSIDLGTGEPGDLQQARECGNWGSSNPSDLFLKVESDPAQGNREVRSSHVPIRFTTMSCVHWKRTPSWAVSISGEPTPSPFQAARC